MSEEKELVNNGESILFHNKISPNFKQVHVDGALGGLTPKGLLNFNFFSERFTIPKATEYRVVGEGSQLEKIKDSEDSKDGIIREYEFGVYLTLDTAKSLVSLISTKILELEKIRNEQSANTIPS